MLIDLAELVPISLVGLVRGIGPLRQLLEWHRQEQDIVAQPFQVDVEIVPVDTDRARLELGRVVLGGHLVHADQDLRVNAMPDIALGAGADVEPCRQALDVRGKDVLAAAWNSHGIEGTKQDQVGRITARTVDGPNPDRQVIDLWSGWKLSRRGQGRSSAGERVADIDTSKGGSHGHYPARRYVQWQADSREGMLMRGIRTVAYFPSHQVQHIGHAMARARCLRFDLACLPCSLH